MDEIIKSAFTAPLATVFVVAGMLFLFVAAVGKISGKVEPSTQGRVISGILGLVFIITGLVIYLRQAPNTLSSENTPVQSRPSEAEHLTRDTVQATSNGTSEQPTTPPIAREEKTPGHDITSASKITVGETIHGQLRADLPRDYYTFKTPRQFSGRIRVILRKRFNAVVVVYDAVERDIASDAAGGDDQVSFSFNCVPNADYYIQVKSDYDVGQGHYEIVLREEAQE
jgi:hypothetical protein